MTVSTSTNSVTYVATGATNTFDYDFVVYDESHFVITLDGAGVTSGFTVTGVGDESGGTVVFDSNPTGTLVILRRVPFTQDIDYSPYDPFPAETHERGLDLGVMRDQQLKTSVDQAQAYADALKIRVDGLVDEVTEQADRAEAAEAAAEAAAAAAEAAAEAAEADRAEAAEAAAEAAAAAAEITPSVTEALRRSYAEAGFTLVDGSFEEGGTLTSASDVLLHKASGIAYSGPIGVVAAGTDPTAAGSGYVPRTDVVLRTDLADEGSSVEISGITASDLVSRVATSCDAGEDRSPLGYSPSADVEVGLKQDGKAMDILRRGSINLAKKFRGIRRNCGIISARGGRLSDADAEDFAPLITGVQNSRGLAAYNSVDGVTAYIDATSRPAESWELTTATAFTANSCTIPVPSAEKVKIGDVIKTGGATVYFGIVTSIVGAVVSVDEWASDGSTVGTPSAPVAVEINPVNKIWCLNAIANMESGGRASTAVVAELGVVNNSQSNTVSYPNGVDMIMMQSLFGGGAAYLARGVTSIAKWLYGFMAKGALFNFYSADGVDAPHAGFRENSSALVGLKLSNKNTYSIAWNTSDSDVDLSIDKCPMLIGSRGNNLRLLNDTGVISASRSLSEVTPSYLVGAGPGITITMPPKANHVGGHYYELLFINAGSYTISGGDANVNGATSVTITVLERSYHRVVFDGNQWQTF